MKLNIKKYREAQGLTQDELSLKVNLSRQRISDLERLEDVNCSIATLKSLADVLQCNVDDLLSD